MVPVERRESRFGPKTGAGRFPSTQWSEILVPGESEGRFSQRAVEALARLYWAPIYASLRLRWRQSREEAEDLTQEFFLSILEGSFLKKADPALGRFRNFVRVHLEHFMLTHLRAGRRRRRGGDRRIVSLGSDPDMECAVADAAAVPPDQVLDRQWNRAVLKEAIARLESDLALERQTDAFEVFRLHDLHEGPEPIPSYADLAARLGIKVTQVTNYLFRARRRLYEIVRRIVAESVDGEASLQEELDAVIGSARRS